jgi:hypothetical protein
MATFVKVDPEGCKVGQSQFPEGPQLCNFIVSEVDFPEEGGVNVTQGLDIVNPVEF